MEGKYRFSSCTTWLERNRTQKITDHISQPRDSCNVISPGSLLAAVLRTKHNQLAAKDLSVCKNLPSPANDSGETTEYTDPVNNVTTIIQDKRQGSMSSNCDCFSLASEAEGVPDRPVIGIIILPLLCPAD